MKTATISALLIAATVTVGHAGPFTYELFENSVNHIDLDQCPSQVKSRDVFCRATIQNDGVHIFVFEEAGDRNFIDMLTFDRGEFDVALHAPQAAQ